jgi:hypothetical protein
MAQTREARRARRATGSGNAVCLAANSVKDSRSQRPPQAQNRLCLKFLASRLPALGPKPLFHFLDEVEHGADLRSHLERYAALPADFIKANGGDKFPSPFLHAIDGGEP